MAYNYSTPDSVLSAPAPTRKWLVKYEGTNRRDRRHGYTDTGKHFFKHVQEDATNVPYVKPKKRS